MMRYCYSCKYHYDTVSVYCPNCRERMVNITEDRIASASRPDQSWVVVGGVKDKFIGEMAVDTLGSSNIPSMFLPSLDLKEFTAVPVVKINEKKKNGNLIMVPFEYRDEAIIVLSDFLGDAFDTNQRKNHWI